MGGGGGGGWGGRVRSHTYNNTIILFSYLQYVHINVVNTQE